MVPDLPTAHAVLLSAAAIPLRPCVVVLVCRAHVAPPSEVWTMSPPGLFDETAHTVLLSTAATPRRFLV
eukprot:gene46433-47753_t